MISIVDVPVYLEAKSKDLLIELMIETNRDTGVRNRYFDFMKDGDKYICWYYRDLRMPKAKEKHGDLEPTGELVDE